MTAAKQLNNPPKTEKKHKGNPNLKPGPGRPKGSQNKLTKTVKQAVLDARYESLRPVILITNAGAAALKSYLGERAYSRLCETAGLILFTWESHRGDRLTMKKWEVQA